jgi:hypothetical protein
LGSRRRRLRLRRNSARLRTPGRCTRIGGMNWPPCIRARLQSCRKQLWKNAGLQPLRDQSSRCIRRVALRRADDKSMTFHAVTHHETTNDSNYCMRSEGFRIASLFDRFTPADRTRWNWHGGPPWTGSFPLKMTTARMWNSTECGLCVGEVAKLSLC